MPSYHPELIKLLLRSSYHSRLRTAVDAVDEAHCEQPSGIAGRLNRLHLLRQHCDRSLMFEGASAVQARVGSGHRQIQRCARARKSKEIPFPARSTIARLSIYPSFTLILLWIVTFGSLSSRPQTFCRHRRRCIVVAIIVAIIAIISASSSSSSSSPCCRIHHCLLQDLA